MSVVRKANKEAADATRGGHLHGFLDILGFTDFEVGGIEQACFEIVRQKNLHAIKVVVNPAETRQRRAPYIVWVAKVPNRNDIFVDHMQACFNCVASKI